MEQTGRIGIQEVGKESTATTHQHGISWDNAYAWQIQKEQVDYIWHRIAGHIQRWCDSGVGDSLPDDIKELAKAGKMQLFAVHTVEEIKLVVITEFAQYPQLKVLRLVGVVGENAFVARKFLRALEVWAIMNGATEMETLASDKILKFDIKLGFKPLATLMRKKLSLEI